MTRIQARNSIVEFLNFVFPPGSWIEIRARRPDTKMMCGLFRDPVKAANFALAASLDYRANVWYCINPISQSSRYGTMMQIDRPTKRTNTGAREQDGQI